MGGPGGFEGHASACHGAEHEQSHRDKSGNRQTPPGARTAPPSRSSETSAFGENRSNTLRIGGRGPVRHSCSPSSAVGGRKDGPRTNPHSIKAYEPNFTVLQSRPSPAAGSTGPQRSSKLEGRWVQLTFRPPGQESRGARVRQSLPTLSRVHSGSVIPAHPSGHSLTLERPRFGARPRTLV